MDTLIPTQRSVSQLIQDFEAGNIAIPEIQRDVVWDAEQVKGLIDSINKGYPCGALILWEPRERDERLVKSMIRPERLEQFDNRIPQYFLLDGQQRLTALASIMLKRIALRDLLYELEEEMPYIYANLKKFPKEIEATQDGAGYKFPWVLLNHLFDGSAKEDAMYKDSLEDKLKIAIDQYVQRIRDYQFPIQIIRGRDYATVGDIFARVNSLGTQLTGAEIHLANIVPHWPGITKEFRDYRKELRQNKYDLDLTFLMRAITVIECGFPQIKKLAERVSKQTVTKRHLNKSWRKAKKATEVLRKLLQAELCLDKTKFFVSKNVLVPLVYYAANEPSNHLDQKAVLRFFLMSQLGEHYGSAGESVLRRDLKYLTEPEVKAKVALRNLLHSVEQEARQNYRGLRIRLNDIAGLPSKNVMVLLMYIIMRKRGATDFGVGPRESIADIESRSLQMHHIFPFNFMMADKGALSYRDFHQLSQGEYRAEVNDIANLTFLSQTKNVAIGDVAPWQYLRLETTKEIRRMHFVPENESLWKPENFGKFLDERRKMMAKAMNSLLNSLR